MRMERNLWYVSIGGEVCVRRWTFANTYMSMIYQRCPHASFSHQRVNVVDPNAFFDISPRKTGLRIVRGLLGASVSMVPTAVTDIR